MMNNIKIIGIDPAPTKKSTIYDGNSFFEKNYIDLGNYLQEQKESKERVLICWDAPLSFNRNAENITFSKRPIERFFSKKRTL